MNRNLMKVLLVTVICCVSHSASRAQISVAPTTNRVGAATISGSTTEGISYQGGPVMLTPHNVYYVWYGNWSGNSALTILPSLALGLNGSPYFATNTTYSNSTPQNINTSVSMSSQTFDNYSQGTSLSLGAVQSVVSSAISRGAFPVDPNGVYFVLTSADVDQFNVLSNGTTQRFCNNYCGWHTHANMFSTDIKFAFVGNADRCIGSCAVTNFSVSPNNNPGADAMASVVAHELDETVTDPDINAWVDFLSDGSAFENGDRCAYTYGNTFSAGNGSVANVSLGGLNFLIQENWVNDGGGFCAMHTTGNPFSYRIPRDQQLACYGIAVAPNFPTNCNDITDPNDKQMCFGLSQRSQTPCQSITDRNLRLACFGMSVSPNFPTNCRDITDPQMQNFCYGVSSSGSMSNCSSVTDPNARALCNAVALHDASFCSSITPGNDQLFCQGVASGSQTPCTSIQ
ncbi:MAG TPA: hypothetical protein VFR08_00340 [Candidatus Angelobacter sp.]|nr:hypothetical protein [Candidatus Angelobacter sp.]